MLNFAHKYTVNMLHVPKIINKSLSIRLSLMIVLAMSILLLASMVCMLYFSRKAVKEEATLNAQQTLDGTISRIDNVLLSAEQTAGNFYFMMLPHLNQPEQMYKFSRELVESNPFIIGCAIAFEPGFYEEGKEFMAYYHRADEYDSTLVRSETFGYSRYTQQAWYKQPIQTGRSGWMNPMSDVEGVTDPIVTFGLPIHQSGSEKPIGVMGIDVSLKLLSDVVLASKPSRHSYSILFDGDGTYIVHPDTSKLFHQTIFTQEEYKTEDGLKEAADAMLRGESGYRPFMMNGAKQFIFYKPFTRLAVKGRSMETLNWHVGIVYPKEDVYGEYDNLLYYVFALAIVGLILMYILCHVIIRYMLHPLKLLTTSAQRIAEGKFDERIPASHHSNEIGHLQDNFRAMQQSLAVNIGEMEQQKATLQEREEELKKAYNDIKKADRMKTAFLHNMTNQMINPAAQINKDVSTLCAREESAEQMVSLAENIQKNGDTITKLLNDLIDMSEEEMRKEDAYEED